MYFYYVISVGLLFCEWLKYKNKFRSFCITSSPIFTLYLVPILNGLIWNWTTIQKLDWQVSTILFWFSRCIQSSHPYKVHTYKQSISKLFLPRLFSTTKIKKNISVFFAGQVQLLFDWGVYTSSSFWLSSLGSRELSQAENMISRITEWGRYMSDLFLKLINYF